MLIRVQFWFSDYLINIAGNFRGQMTLHDNPLLITFSVLFAISFLIQAFYNLYYYLAPPLYKHPEKLPVKVPVSVIICARNEEVNLRRFLPAVLEQDYHAYEVIVVNDCSDEDSYLVLAEYMKKYPHLRITNILKDPKFTHNKKFAQFIGIKAAKNELLVFTDADCRPDGKNWLGTMASGFDSNTGFVLGYGGYLSEKGLLNKYIRYDCMTIAMQYLGMAIRGNPYMGVGRNLAYRRSLFFSKKGFSSHTHLASGDDDLFVNANASARNVKVEFRPGSHTRSVSAESAGELYKQKKRHLTTANYYKFRDRLMLMAEPFSRVLFYVSFAVLISGLFLWPYVLGLFAVRIIVLHLVFFHNSRRFNEPGLLPCLLLFDILSPVINALFYIGSQRDKSAKTIWN